MTETVDCVNVGHSFARSGAGDHNPKFKLNANAKEFLPSAIPYTATKPVVPEIKPTRTLDRSNNELLKQVMETVSGCGVSGIFVHQLPAVYQCYYNRSLDLSSCSFADLSVFLSCIQSVKILNPSVHPISMHDALLSAGYVEPVVDNP